MTGNDDSRLQIGDLVQSLHPILARFVPGNPEINVVEYSIASHRGAERWNENEAVPGTVALLATLTATMRGRRCCFRALTACARRQ